MSLRILLVEPWFHGSHRRWAEGYCQASRHDVGTVSMPGGRWRWRLRGGALPLADLVGRWVTEHGPPDVVLVSGLVDVAQLVGIVGRRLGGRPPIVIYQHESQLLYPSPRAEEREAVLRNWMSWCAADLVVFNSEYHRRAVVERLPAYLEDLPDHSHRPFLDGVVARFEVLPVGVDLASIARPVAGPDGGRAIGADGPIVLWPHRWEADKDPGAFAAAVAKAAEADLDFRLILAGEDPPGGSTLAADSRQAMTARFGDRIVAQGPFERSRYLELVAEADLVVSCAHHEFFGVGVVEAIAAGAVPLLPAKLSYPELIGEEWQRASLYRPGTFGSALLDALADFDRRARTVVGLAETMDRFDWSVVAPRYDDRFAALCD